MLHSCPQCGKEFNISTKAFNQNNKRSYKCYCSNTCANLGKVTSVIASCYTCGKEIRVSQKALLKSKSGNNFCSRHCSIIQSNKSSARTLKNHPNWVDGSSMYRAEAMKAFENRCAICGYDNKDALIVHHIDKNRTNGALDNLIILCPNHHKEIHLGIASLPNIPK